MHIQTLFLLIIDIYTETKGNISVLIIFKLKHDISHLTNLRLPSFLNLSMNLNQNSFLLPITLIHSLPLNSPNDSI